MGRRLEVINRARTDLTADASRFAKGWLPPVRVLARRWESSSKTVVAALKALVGDGFLLQDPVSGRYYLRGSQPPREQTAPWRPKSSLVYEKLREEIFLRKPIAGSQLLSVGEVRSRFECSYRTAHAALTQLVAAGFAVQAGRRFSVGTRPVRGRPGFSRVFVTGLPRMLVRPQVLAFLRALETTLLEAGWDFPGYHVAPHGRIVPPPPDNAVAAYVFLHNQVSVSEGFVPYRERRTIPQIVLDLTEQGPFDGAGCRSFIKIQPDNTRAGFDIGHHLAARGHRRIAFVTHVPQSHLWVTRRLQGLRDGVVRAGQDMSVEVVDLSQVHLPEVGHRQNGNIKETFRSILSSPLIPQSMSEILLGQFEDAPYQIRRLGVLAKAYRSRLVSIARNEDFSAWVCANDELAFVATHVLRSSGTDVPGDVSVVGFDNIEVSILSDIATYDFNVGEMGALAAQFCIRPETVLRQFGHFVKVKGRIVPRGSMGVHPV